MEKIIQRVRCGAAYWLAALTLLAAAPCARAESERPDPSEEFIVSADLLNGVDRPDDAHCALAISANHINGQFVALVLQVLGPYPTAPTGTESAKGTPRPGAILKISPGTVDWRNGIESYIEPDVAWIEAAELSTADMGEQRSEPYAKVYERVLSGQEALRVYRAMLTGPVTVHVDSAGLASIYPLQSPFAPDVVARAEGCIDKLLEAPM